MLQNAYLLAKIGADTAENQQNFAEILPIGRRVPDRLSAGSQPRGHVLQAAERGADVRIRQRPAQV